MSAYNGSGTFVITGVGLPYVTATTISSTVANQLNTDLASGLSTAICKDGQTTTTTVIPFASGVTLSGGATLQTYTIGGWTPSDASGAGLVLAVAQGSYLKIGRLVFVGGIVTYPTTADGSAAKIGSLPFSGSSATGLSRQIVPVALTTGTNPGLIVTAANTTFTLQTITGGGTAITNATMTGTQIQFNGIYLTDTA